MRILLIDDEPDVRRSLSGFLGKLGHTVTCCVDGVQGLKMFHAETFDLIITDIRMPGMDGLEVLRRIKKVEKSPVDVIVVTGHGDMENAIMALKYGAHDYLQKPINVRELAITIDRAAEYATLKSNYLSLKDEFHERILLETEAVRGEAEKLRTAYLKEIGLDDLCVYSDAMRQVIRQAEKYSADRSIPVLVQGESGTGKELVARYIHHYAQGSALNPFVAINCGAISRELFEGELFGHEGGAYTGATASGRKGKLEAANGGTLFLDEIGEMPPDMQVKLLRVLDEKRFFRVGGIEELPVDIRVISATNKDLNREVAEKRFRLDLYYRVNTGTIYIPPLRERSEDILPLALRFAGKAFSRAGRRFGGFTGGAEKFLLSYPWPGNIRQLKNAMERLSVMGPWDRVRAEDLSFVKDSTHPLDAGSEARPVLGEDDFILPEEKLEIEALNRRIIRKALEKNHGNKTRTAQYLGISRRVLQGRIKKMGLS